MQRNIKSLVGFRLEATDGEVGKVKDFYFDDQQWVIRYLIVKTGNWLSYREVLISPVAIIKESYDTESFPVNLTKDQVRNSPDIDTDKPVYRQHELELFTYYPWKNYWDDGFYCGGVWSMAYPTVSIADNTSLTEDDNIKKQKDDDPHLRSTQAITGYHVHAIDGEIGHVSDFIIDDKTWQLLFFVLDTHNWFGGKKVLIAVSHVKEVQWDNSKVVLNITMDEVKHSKEFYKPEAIFPVNVFEI